MKTTVLSFLAAVLPTVFVVETKSAAVLTKTKYRRIKNIRSDNCN